MVASKRKKIYFYIFWPVLVITFTLAAFFVILVANGYHLDRNTWKLEKTGTIVLNGPTTGGNVNLDGIDAGSLPVSLRMLSAGRHEIIVSKENYQTWTKVFNVLPGRAVLVENLTLFYTNPVFTKVVNNKEKLTTNVKNDSVSQKKDLEIKSDEVYLQGKLVTRFSQPITSAIYDSTINHIYVQIGSEIRAVNVSDLNEFTLIKLPKIDPVIFSISGSTLYYQDGEELYQGAVR